MADVLPLAAAPAGVDEAAWVAACAAVRAYCGWHVAPSVTETVTVDGSGAAVQLLPTLHLTGVTSITTDGVTVADPEWSEAGMVRGCWSAKYRGVVATITHGFDACPVELLAVVKAVAARAAADELTYAGGQVSQVGQVRYVLPREAAGDGTDRWDGPAYEAAILDRYRLPARP